jgi:DNA-binding cell septation regulator SpoVG
MIEIKNFEPCDKGFMKGKISIRVKKWGNFCIHDIGLFQKEGKSWLAFPNRKVKINETEEKWLPYMIFEDPEMNRKFLENVKEVFDAQFK